MVLTESALLLLYLRFDCQSESTFLYSFIGFPMEADKCDTTIVVTHSPIPLFSKLERPQCARSSLPEPIRNLQHIVNINSISTNAKTNVKADRVYSIEDTLMFSFL